MVSIFSPLQSGEIAFTNRIVLAPLTRCRSPGHIPNQLNADYYQQRASAGLLITEGTFVSPLAVGFCEYAPGVFTEAQVQGWRKVVSAVHSKGGTIVCQLWFVGPQSHSSLLPAGSHVMAPSVLHGNGHVYGTGMKKYPIERPKALTQQGVLDMVDAYGNAAKMALKAGFDGVEINADNGYMIDCFLRSCTNIRNDSYGGSPEHRFRVLAQILLRVGKEIGFGRVAVRLSPFQLCADDNDMFAFVARRLNTFNLSYLHIIDFGTNALTMIRSKYKGTIVGNGGYAFESASNTIARGQADAISFGQLYMTNPDLVARFSHGWSLTAPMPPKFHYQSPNASEPWRYYMYASHQIRKHSRQTTMQRSSLPTSPLITLITIVLRFDYARHTLA